MTRLRGAEILSEARVNEAVYRTPADHYVIWDGNPCPARTGSLRSRALALVEEPWTPVQVRDLLRRAAAIEDGAGLDPDMVRNALRLHQTAHPAVYLLTRRICTGDYVALTDIPWPYGCKNQPLRAGAVVMDRNGAPMTVALKDKDMARS
ncbi:MAG: hypothetical protein Q8M88_03955 [Phenylobacterium sp.]|uniref:hypothetical protein n=1 Tax=Phenylobacterium sp. TaxID=1871053 RepID=UPI0027324B3C|nr:hypothetical protein [Phenylobacterium sp.]MDP3173570.1 hypothetical protein [Phenylobacterium sp.]